MKKVILVILDGWGAGRNYEGNAIKRADTPTLNEIENFYPGLTLSSSGMTVGLLWGEAGNSETGHLTIGSGRTVYGYLARIIFSIRNKSFFDNTVLKKAAEHVKANNSNLHIMGLLSSGSVHSYLDHLYALIDFAKKEKIKNVIIHPFTDGKDSPPNEGIKLIRDLKLKLKEFDAVKIGTVMGRFYAMDRAENWQRIEKAYECLTRADGNKFTDPENYIYDFYKKKVFDEFIEPGVMVDKNSEPMGKIKDNDAIIFFNYREDSVRELTKAFTSAEFSSFNRENFLKNLYFVTMTQYEENLPVHVAFPPIEIKNTLGEVLSQNKINQLRIAETEKYAHITYFFNGGKEEPLDGEKRILVPSSSVPHFENSPEMMAPAITEALIEEFKKETYGFAVANFANADMIAHTGDLKATLKTIEVVDECISRLIKFSTENNITLIITGDHGNAEEMLNEKTGEVLTEHTTNPVPFYLIDEEFKKNNASANKLENPLGQADGLLTDIAPTILDLMKIKKPEEMTGKSLLNIIKNKYS